MRRVLASCDNVPAVIVSVGLLLSSTHPCKSTMIRLLCLLCVFPRCRVPLSVLKKRGAIATHAPTSLPSSGVSSQQAGLLPGVVLRMLSAALNRHSCRNGRRGIGSGGGGAASGAAAGGGGGRMAAFMRSFSFSAEPLDSDPAACPATPSRGLDSVPRRQPTTPPPMSRNFASRCLWERWERLRADRLGSARTRGSGQ